MILLKRPGRFDSLFQVYGEAHGLDPQLLKAQAMAESDLDPHAVSRVGAKGLAQFMDLTWAEIAPGLDPFNPEHSIAAQAWYLATLIHQFANDVPQAVAAYNWGQGHVRQVRRDHGDDWLAHCPSETQAYVARILALWHGMKS